MTNVLSFWRVKQRDWQRIAQFAFPWLSLAFGISSAVMMDRRPERAWVVVFAVALSWGALVVTALLERLNLKSSKRFPAWLVSLLHFSGNTAVQNPVQMALFFSLPFYIQAHAHTLGHSIFICIIILAALATLWEPLFHRAMEHPFYGRALQVLASFAGLNSVFPILGLANRLSLWAAAIGTGAMVVFAEMLAAKKRERGGALKRALLTAAILPGLLSLGLVRHIVPAAPMRLLATAVGTGIKARSISDPTDNFSDPPSQLVCFSSIWAPRGLKDELYHVWSHNAHVVDRIALRISGGREAGFRTWSIKEHLGKSPQGRWVCRIETAAGQVLGQRDIVIK